MTAVPHGGWIPIKDALPNSVITLEGEQGQWRVVKTEVGDNVRLSLESSSNPAEKRVVTAPRETKVWRHGPRL